MQFVENRHNPIQSDGCDTGNSKYIPRVGDDPRQAADRIRRAANLNATIFPVAPGMYHITSKSGETYVVDLDGYAHGEERAICECRDYRYRAAPAGFDCKHIVVAKQQVRYGLLPPLGVDPVDWLKKRLNELKKCTFTERQENKIAEMRNRPYYIEYRQFLVDLNISQESIGKA